MQVLSRSDLWTLEDYAEQRPQFRAQVMAHKKNRQLPLGDNARLYFEDLLTIRYQVQEMLRIEKVFDAQGINEELEAYNPLIPDGTNLKATVMLEFEDIDIRRQRLAELVGIEHLIWMQVGDGAKVFAIANEDLERSTAEKTSAVHFMRFELTDRMIEELRAGGLLSFGSDHEFYGYHTDVDSNTRTSLLADFS